MANNDPGYKLSRAALRDRYGARAITYGGQSARDTTPSGRERYAMERGASKSQAAQYSAQQFQDAFGPQQQILTPIAANIPPVGSVPRVQPQGLVMPDVGRMIQMGGQGAFPMLSTPPAEQLIEFMPASVSPLGSFGLPKPKSPYMGGILAGANKWRAPV